MRRLIVLLPIISISLLFAVPVKAAISGGTWTLTNDALTGSSMTGVSPFVEKLANGKDRVWRSEIGGPKVDDCDETGSCTPVQLSSRFGNDVTIVTLKDGSRRAYFVDIAPGGGKEIRTAGLGADGVSHGTVTSTGLSASADQNAWGVPDSVVTPDGRVRLYYVDVEAGTSNCPEVIKSATSTDTTGVTFVKDSGNRLTGGYVDSEVLRAKVGDWVMITSTGPGCAPQRLFIFTSDDGLTWKAQGGAVSGSDKNRLDPTGYKLSDNKFRIYYSYSVLGKALSGPYTIGRATLSWNAKPAKPIISITCIKGKIKKTVSGVNPKCPVGYKKVKPS